MSGLGPKIVQKVKGGRPPLDSLAFLGLATLKASLMLQGRVYIPVKILNISRGQTCGVYYTSPQPKMTIYATNFGPAQVGHLAGDL